MLARLQLKYGYHVVAQYNETMAILRTLFEREGVVLRQGMITRVGRLNEAWNLWEIQDQAHIARALKGMASYPTEIGPVLLKLAEIVEHEDVHFLESLPFAEPLKS
jgi:hypothetical protein